MDKGERDGDVPILSMQSWIEYASISTNRATKCYASVPMCLSHASLLRCALDTLRMRVAIFLVLVHGHAIGATTEGSRTS